MIIVLVGHIGSGKSKLSKALAKTLKFKFLEVSSVVKKLLGTQNRSSLVRESLHKKDQDPLWLAEPLRQKLVKSSSWVISGVREVSLLDAIRESSRNVLVIDLQCPPEVRLKRCKDRFKMVEDLLKADEVDNGLGLQEVIRNADISISTAGTYNSTIQDLTTALSELGVVI